MLAIVGATLIDGTGRDPQPNTTVSIGAERIVSIGNASSDAQRIDGTGLTLLPGLIDLHTHMAAVTLANPEAISPAELAAHLFRNAELCLESGHTTAREVGGADGGLARAIDAGLVRGPRLFPSGPMLSQRGGHGDSSYPWVLDHHHRGMDHPGLAQMAVVCDGPDQVRFAARTAFHRGATQIKVCASGGVASRTDRLEDAQFSVAELRAAVEEARARDTYVTAHAHNTRAIRNGLEAGLECFEHGTFLDEETAAKMAAAGAALVPTLTVMHLFANRWREWGIPEEGATKIQGVAEAMTNSVRIATAAGVTVGSGTDLLGPEQNQRGLELALKARILGPMAAIMSATATNAAILRRGGDLGTVEVGKIADLVAVDFDPLSNPELFADPSRVVLVIKDGAIAKNTRT